MNPSPDQFARIIKHLAGLNSLQRIEVERFVAGLTANRALEPIRVRNTTTSTDWPHAPVHRLHGKGTFMVTASTLEKAHLFRDVNALDYLEHELITVANRYAWQLEAWAVFSNHYHFVGHALEDARTLGPFLGHLHSNTAREINERDGVTDRPVWFNYWDTELTFEKSYLARLNYVHQNPVRHGLVPVANQYRWCSAAWFERTATPAQVKTIYSFKTDRVNVVDDFDVMDVMSNFG